MLKGIKKGQGQSRKINSQESGDKAKSSSNFIESSEASKNITVNDQPNFKVKAYIQQKNDTLGQEDLNQQSFEKYEEDGCEFFKLKAAKIFDIYASGNLQLLRKQFEAYEQAQHSYFQKLMPENTHSIKDRQHQDISDIKLEGQKRSKFQYTMNFEESDQQAQKKDKKRQRDHHRDKKSFIKSQKMQQYCPFCPENGELKILSASNYVYLALAVKKTFKKYWHLILAPVEHQQTSVGLNEDTLTEINNYKKCLLQMFDQKRMHVVFFEQFCKENSHIYIECLAVPLAKAQDFPFFFKQALDTVEGNWNTHKNIIRIEKQKGGLQKQIPKKIKYFYIDFSLGYGYAHAIQNEQFWKSSMCHQVLASALGVELYEIKTAEEFDDKEKEEKQRQFRQIWDHYDWTKYID